jgi:hypothetical protein
MRGALLGLSVTLRRIAFIKIRLELLMQLRSEYFVILHQISSLHFIKAFAAVSIRHPLSASGQFCGSVLCIEPVPVLVIEMKKVR